MADDATDVIVVGGGPGGSATALRLARAGHRVTLLDRARFPRHKACSEYTSPQTLRHLDGLGVLHELDAGLGTALRGTRVTAAGGQVLTGDFSRAGGTPFRPTGLALPRLVLDHVLLRAAADAGVTVREGMTVLDLRGADAEGRAVQVRDGDGAVHRLRARVVVGADGLRSTVARRAGLRRAGRLRRVAFVAHVRDVRGLSDIAELHVGVRGYVGLNPLGHGVTNVALVVPATDAANAKGQVHAFVQSRLDALPGVRGRVDLARMTGELMTTGPFDATTRRSVDDALLLVGDAADFFDPFTGEGICTALAGADLAAGVISRALRQPGAVTRAHLEPYRTARRRAFLGKWLVERMIGYAMLAPSLFDRAIDRLERRGMADTLIGVTGQFVSPWKVLNPVFLARMIV